MNLLEQVKETLFQADRDPKSYEMSDEERKKILEWQARNVWNPPELAEQDHPDNQHYYGA